jgi:Cof subfamily protein (haloacid dehalogenase superfamily)
MSAPQSVPPTHLFATDLDGTLVDAEDRIHPRDLAAIAAARASGVVFTIATGRLTNRTHPVARAMALRDPLVCADGAVLACGATERILARKPVPAAVVERILEVFGERGVARFVFTHGSIHSCPLGTPHHDYLSAFSRAITTHHDLLGAEAWRVADDAPVMVVGIGSREHIDAMAVHIEAHAEHVDAVTFDSARGRVLRLIAKGASKGAALAELTQELGIPRENVAVAGDWYNDLSMFDFAGRSFVMPQAPDDVKSHGTDVLGSGARERGPIAEALEAWLGRQ